MLLVLSLLASPAWAQKPKPEFAMSAGGELVIAPDGTVRTWKMDSNRLGEEVQALLQRNVEQWRFEPILMDGKAVTARTRMTVELEALPQGEGYLLKVARVWFGSLQSRGTVKPPSYPNSAVRAGLGARVLLAVKLDAEGNVVAMHPYQTSLSKWGSEKQAQRWRRRFEQASMNAVKDWKYVPGETIGGVTVGSSVIVPIVFQIANPGEGRRTANVWRGYAPGPISPAPWSDQSSVAALDTGDLADGQAAALDSPFRLRSDVLGKTL